MIYSPQQLANSLLLIRQKNKWTQSEVAKRVGIKQGQATISNFENRPDKATLSTMFKIIQALDLTVKIETRNESNGILDEGDW